MGKEFMAFMKQYGVIGLAIAVIIGGKANTFVTALVDNLAMPLVGMVTPGGNWRTLAVGPFGIGPILGGGRRVPSAEGRGPSFTSGSGGFGGVVWRGAYRRGLGLVRGRRCGLRCR